MKTGSGIVFPRRAEILRASVGLAIPTVAFARSVCTASTTVLNHLGVAASESSSTTSDAAGFAKNAVASL